MKKPAQLMNASAPVRPSLPHSPLRRGFLLPLVITIACSALSLRARAVSPPPDGGYPNQNTAEGQDALLNLTSGINNTAVGFNALFSVTTGAYNTAVGSTALFSATAGNWNTALGEEALFSNTTGSANTAIGLGALYKNITGSSNTGTGFGALTNYTIGGANTACGYQALLGGNNGFGTGSNNSGVGFRALAYNEAGNNNTATGSQALINYAGSNNTATGYLAMEGVSDPLSTGSNNTATGMQALAGNTTGISNAADGFQALFNNTTGSFNTASGQGALSKNTTGANNTAVGQNALLNSTTGKSNIALGSNAGLNLTTGSSNIEIGNRGVAGESKTIRVGTQGTQTAAFIAGISGATIPAGVGVIVDTNGRLGTVVSSARFKDGIKPIDKASEAILALKPVTFRYKHELDPDGIPQFGLVAEEVAKVDPDLVIRDEEGKPYTVRYNEVNAMLLNEFLKAHHRAEQQDATISELESVVAKQQEQITALASQIKTVSNRLELSKGAARVVASEP